MNVSLSSIHLVNIPLNFPYITNVTILMIVVLFILWSIAMKKRFQDEVTLI